MIVSGGIGFACRRGASFALVISVASSLVLGACATLPADEATAFKKMASAKSEAFTSLAGAEATAISDLAAQNVVSGAGRFTVHDCSSAEDAKTPCLVTYVDGGAQYPITTAAPHARGIVSDISDYGAAMADLAEAKDLDSAKAKSDAVGASIKGLAATVGASPFVAPIVDAGAWLNHKRLVEKRRQILLIAARKANPLVEAAATQLGAIAAPIRTHLLAASSRRVTNAATRVGLLSKDQVGLQAQVKALKSEQILERTALQRALADNATDVRLAIQDLMSASRSLNSARAIKTDFSGLAKAHETLLKRLDDPTVSLEGALTDLNEFLAQISALEAVAKEGKNG